VLVREDREDNPRLDESLVRELVKPTLDLAEKYAEMSLDSLLTDHAVLRELPLVKTAIAVFKTGVAIRERHFLKKMLSFLKEFHGGRESDEAGRFKDRINTDSNFREKISEHLLVMLDRFTSVEKAQILGHLFRAHINGHIDWDDFLSCSFSLDALQQRGYQVLRESAKQGFGRVHLTQDDEAILFGSGLGWREGTRFAVTPLGQKL
jgi:hypothetical protein